MIADYQFDENFIALIRKLCNIYPFINSSIVYNRTVSCHFKEIFIDLRQCVNKTKVILFSIIQTLRY